VNLQRIATRRTAGIAAGAVAAALAVGTTTLAPAASAAETAPAPICPSGYVCLYANAAARPVLIPQGERRTFPGGLTVQEYVNATKIGYCVSGQISFGLPAGAHIVRPNRTVAVGPGEFCPT
jgi:hypothetical protein